MKNIITLLALTMITFTTATANVNPETETVVVEKIDLLTSTSFDTVSETLDFTTKSNIAMIQIFDKDGNMTFQLPVMSNSVQINKNLFNKGTSKMSFVIEGEKDVHVTTIRIK